ncbi:MAG: hypothetical protein FJ276_27420 [Planctomycetes bacterium]|nr:hypothetical protein [Planctomycetota bacterium]
MEDSQDRTAPNRAQDKLNVLGHQAKRLDGIDQRSNEVLDRTDESIAASETVLERYGKHADPLVVRGTERACLSRPPVRPWDELVAEAEKDLTAPVSFSDILSWDELDAAKMRVSAAYEEFNARHRLDATDLSICGAAGVLAALADVLLVWMPQHRGFLGAAASDGGPLANWVRGKINSQFTPEEIHQLEESFRVPYDHTNSSKLEQPVAGLSPGTHRFHSLGHDPVLCWVFGVRDVLQNTVTTIDKNGCCIVQGSAAADPGVQTMTLFGAVARVLGHLKSDVATPAGLPAPLMPLLQMFQFGRFGTRGHTVADLSRIMYRSGYDFRHFLAMSISPLLVEIVVRICYFAKRLDEGRSLEESVPFNLPNGQRQPKLGTMLFTAHFIATAANAGKLAIAQNPLTINWPQWLAFVRYAVPQLKWALLGKDDQRDRFVQAALNDRWSDLYGQLDETWRQVFAEPVLLK